MIAKKSPFMLHSFLLLRQNLEFIAPSFDSKIDILEITDSYLIDIDFNLKDPEGDFYQMYLKIEINRQEKRLAGYSIIVEGVGFFGFDKSVVISDQEKGNYLYFSGTPICISSLRSIVAGITAYCPFGRYTLPSIDLNALLVSKGILKQK